MSTLEPEPGPGPGKENHMISPDNLDKSCQGSLKMVVGTSYWHKNQ